MASEQKFVDFILDQIGYSGQITNKKMFGEYAIYLGAKTVALLCDNQLFLKPTSAGRALLPNAAEGAPYPGAKPHLLMSEHLDDSELLSRAIRATEAALPLPKPKKPKAPRKNG